MLTEYRKHLFGDIQETAHRLKLDIQHEDVPENIAVYKRFALRELTEMLDKLQDVWNDLQDAEDEKESAR